MKRALFAILSFCIPLAAGDVGAQPQRVVSLNPCLDAVLVNVAARDQIAALSHYSLDPEASTISDIAQTLPTTHGTAEEVIRLQPDLVLTSRHSHLATRKVLQRLDIRTELFNEPQNVAASIAQVREIAALVGQPERGENVARNIEAAIQSATPPTGATPISALLFQRDGFSTGSGSLVHEMMERAGFHNVAYQYGLKGWGNIALEQVVLHPPDVLFAAEVRPSVPTWADRVMRHPALQAQNAKMQRITFPDRYFFCGGPVLIPAANLLLEARQSVLHTRALKPVD